MKYKLAVNLEQFKAVRKKVGFTIKLLPEEMKPFFLIDVNLYNIHYYYDLEEFNEPNDEATFISFEEFMNLDLKEKKPFILKPFDKVLVRDKEGGEWGIELFERLSKKNAPHRFLCLVSHFTMVAPYEGNEHFLGTKDHIPNSWSSEDV